MVTFVDLWKGRQGTLFVEMRVFFLFLFFLSLFFLSVILLSCFCTWCFFFFFLGVGVVQDR